MMNPCARVARIACVLGFLALCGVAGIVEGAGSAYPSRPVRLIVPGPPGGGTDLLARVIAPVLSEAMGQAWVVENRAGAAGNLAAELVAHSEPDGHTVFLALNSQLTISPSLYKLPFSVERDLQAVAMLTTQEFILVVNPSIPAKTFKDFIAYARQKSPPLHYASAGAGSPPHLGAELLKKRAGIDMVNVPYKGGGPAAVALLANETQVMISAAAATIDFIKNGRLRALASVGSKRSKILPDVPTVAESGYPGFEVAVWYALCVAGSTPRNIVDRIYSESQKAMQRPEVQAAVARLGMEPQTGTPEELASRIRSETAVWAGVIKEAGIKGE